MSQREDLRKMVRRRQKTLQELFEEWHSSNKEKDEQPQKPDWLTKIAEAVSSLDSKKWNSYVAELQSVIETVQMMLADFGEMNRQNSRPSALEHYQAEERE